MTRICILISFFLINTIEGKTQGYFQEEFPKVWERSTNYTKAIVKAMPEKLYDFKAYEDGMSFKEQQLHIVDNISFLTNYITGDFKSFYKKDKLDELNKQQVLEILDSAFNYVSVLIENTETSALSEEIIFKDAEMSKQNIFYLIRSHIIHHMGQSVFYLRMNNIKAPTYVGW
ncbi:DinB family protein [Marivirga sp.]|uniref:DinB family protein n=1 Tax=Marivirga sp. TaxID=2018662 RepID=UPI0025F9D654|nr:DinB family protein [Marivirga sp.]